MALTYPPFTPGVLVPANFLNDVRDHINDHKHAELELLIPASAMTRPTNSTATLADLQWQAGGANNIIHCPITLLAGTVVQSILVHGRDTSSAEFHVEAIRRPLLGTSTEPINSDGPRSSDHQNGPATVRFLPVDDGFPFLIQPSHTYGLRIRIDNAPNVMVYAAQLIIRRD